MRKTSLLAVFVLTLALLVALPAAANTQNSGTLNFSTSGQSMWSSGNAFNFSDNRNLVDISLAGSSSFLGVINANSTGDVGLSSSLSVNGGTVSATVPVDVTLGFPGLVPNATPFNITSSGMFGVGTLSTASPNIQASASLFANNVGGSIGISGFGNIVSLGPFSGSVNLFSIDSKTFPPQTLNLAPGVDLSIGLPFVATNGSAGPAPFPPPLSINSSGGPSNFLGLNANITNMVAAALGLPPLSASIDLGPCLPIVGCAGSASYNLLTISAGLNLGGKQTFNLSATPLVAYKVMEFGANAQNFTTAAMTVGTPFTLSLPNGVTMADITPIYFMSADLMNKTDLALSASAALSAFGGCAKYLGLGGCFGPLIDLSKSFPLADINVFDSTFALDNWNVITGETFEIKATPEPGTLLLFGSGVLALARGLRRRSSKA